MRGNKSPAPPALTAPRGGVLNPSGATLLIKYLNGIKKNITGYLFDRYLIAEQVCQILPPKLFP